MKISVFRPTIAEVREVVEVESNGIVIGVWTPVGRPDVRGDAVPTLIKDNHTKIEAPKKGEIEELLNG